jgi:hypothetical protein
LEIGKRNNNIQNKKYMNFSAQQVELCCVVLHKTTHDAKKGAKKQAQKYGRQSWFSGIFR